MRRRLLYPELADSLVYNDRGKTIKHAPYCEDSFQCPTCGNWNDLDEYDEEVFCEVCEQCIILENTEDV